VFSVCNMFSVTESANMQLQTYIDCRLCAHDERYVYTSDFLEKLAVVIPYLCSGRPILSSETPFFNFGIVSFRLIKTIRLDHFITGSLICIGLEMGKCQPVIGYH